MNCPAHTLENCTAQGGVINARPCNVFVVLRRVRNCLTIIIIILFLLMINDAAAGLRGVQTSLCADDRRIYQSGRNL